MRPQFAHDRRRALEVIDRFEERHHHQPAVALLDTAEQAGFLLQQRDFKQIGQGFGVRDDVTFDGARTEGSAQGPCGIEHGQFRPCPVGESR